jgi:hypothetical protein
MDVPLFTAISIMPSPGYSLESELEPYFRDIAAAGNSSWRAVSYSPFSEPKVTSVKVPVRELDPLEDQRLEIRQFHHEPEEGEGEEFRFGPFADFDPEEDVGEEDGHLLMRCGECNRGRKRLVLR